MVARRLRRLMNGALKYGHTVRHLKPVQLYGRVWYRLARPRVVLSAAPPVRKLEAAWTAPVPRSPSLVAPRRLRFLNVDHDLDVYGWTGDPSDLLWTYNLHYFQDLTAEGAAGRSEWHSALLLDWVRSNPPGQAPGWDAYPLSLRTVNWIKWALAGNRLPAECVHSLAVQTRWLERRVEHHLQGNHMIANAKALIFAGAFFEGPESERWLHQGIRILLAQLPEQLLADGGHFELSPMYHALILEDLLDVSNVLATFPSLGGAPALLRDECANHAAGMMRWLRVMCHPDQQISFFNDAAFGIAPTLGELEDYATRLRLLLPPQTDDSLTHLDASGYIRLSAPGALAILDVAPAGAPYQPAHSHADTLSFELSLSGRRVLVNSGTSCYGSGPERQRQRGTAAHNTVIVDGEDSSEVWSSFRLARRADPVDLMVRTTSDAMTVRCAHDGYQRLRGRVLHSRTWEMRGLELRILDELSGAFDKAEARFHLHPAVDIEAGKDNAIVLRLAGSVQVTLHLIGGSWRVDRSTWHPEFGCSIPTSCLVAAFQGSRIETTIAWSVLS